MVEFVSWLGVAVIALFSLVGFAGVVVTSVLTVVRTLRHQAVAAEVVDSHERMPSAA